jgi:hypothetical protein
VDAGRDAQAASARDTELMSLRTLILVAMLPAFSLVATARAGPLTTAPTLVLNVHVTITNTRIVLDRHSAPRGVEARFIVENVTAEAHNITLSATKATGSAQRGFSRTLKPHQRAIVLLFLDYRTRLPYFSGLPADRGKPGMRGLFTVI